MKQQKRHQTNLISNIIILVTLSLLVFLAIVLYNHARLEVRFDTLINWLKQIDDAVVNLDSDTEIIICIFALYIAKCQLPIPMGFLCVISGMVFPLAQAVLINLAFTAFFFIVKYIEGKFIGGGWTGMILGIKQLHFVRDWIQFKGNGNPYVLFVSRLVPSIPLGMVSKYYGSMRYDFIYYTIISLLGFGPRLYIYTKIGAAIYNPFSVQFIVLLMIIVAFTGISVITFNIFYGRKSKQMNQTLLIYSEKEKYKIVL
ncbi:MAG: TVP38/TMEM64 family protein [Eubacterium sp.]